MASPSGLQSGLSRQLFDMWCSDKKNACVIPGYVVEGTLAKTIINEPKEVTLMNGLTAPLNMQVHYISFFAHAHRRTTAACPAVVVFSPTSRKACPQVPFPRELPSLS